MKIDVIRKPAEPVRRYGDHYRCSRCCLDHVSRLSNEVRGLLVDVTVGVECPFCHALEALATARN